MTDAAPQPTPPTMPPTTAPTTPKVPATPMPSRAARRSATWRDLGFLRHLWRNEALVAPGVWRSNHPGSGRLAGFAARGVRHVLNLRGDAAGAPQIVEAATCVELGMELHIINMNARAAPDPDTLLALFEHFDRLPRPFLMHCKSGADRTGLAAALYLLDQAAAPLDIARRQLSLRFLHLRHTKTGMMDHILDLYAPFAPMPVRVWVSDHYDRAAARESFAARPAGARG